MLIWRDTTAIVTNTETDMGIEFEVVPQEKIPIFE